MIEENVLCVLIRGSRSSSSMDRVYIAS
jgi:hypothetical protein